MQHSVQRPSYENENHSFLGVTPQSNLPPDITSHLQKIVQVELERVLSNQKSSEATKATSLATPTPNSPTHTRMSYSNQKAVNQQSVPTQNSPIIMSSNRTPANNNQMNYHRFQSPYPNHLSPVNHPRYQMNQYQTVC